jgi:hypothetical protein
MDLGCPSNLFFWVRGASCSDAVWFLPIHFRDTVPASCVQSETVKIAYRLQIQHMPGYTDCATHRDAILYAWHGSVRTRAVLEEDILEIP